MKLIAVAYDEENRVVTGPKISWASADKNVAAVNLLGTVTAKGKGVIGIAGAIDGVEATFEVAVNGEELPGLPELSLDQDVIEEAVANDGSISSKQIIKLNNGSFREDISVEDVKANRLLDGLEFSVERDDEDQLTVSFAGKPFNPDFNQAFGIIPTIE